MNSDLLIGDKLKSTGAGNLFMVFGEPDIAVTRDAESKVVVEVKGVVRIRPGVMRTLHLEWAERITVRAFDLASHDVTVLVKAKRGPKVVAMIRKKIKVESN